MNKTRIVKVGGSLLENEALPRRLASFLSSWPEYRHVLLAGGGSLVDIVRNWHATHGLSETWSHWASVRLMRETALLLAEICPSLKVYTAIDDLPADGNAILECSQHLRQQSKLERSWSTTSDSIAAEIAEELKADELWLMKSVSPASPAVAKWSADGFVDENFPQVCQSTRPVFVANLADSDLLSVRGI